MQKMGVLIVRKILVYSLPQSDVWYSATQKPNRDGLEF